MKILHKIKRYWGELAISILMLTITTFTIITYTNNKKLVDLNRSSLRAEVVDSIVSSQMRRESAALDSIMRSEASKTSELTSEVEKLRKELKLARTNTIKLQNIADSLYSQYNESDTIECLDVIHSYVEVNESVREENEILESENRGLESINVSLNTQLDAAVKQIQLRDTTILYKDRLIDTKQAIIREYEKQNTWFNKNSNWIFGAAGVAIGVLIAK